MAKEEGKGGAADKLLLRLLERAKSDDNEYTPSDKSRFFVDK
jgi:hypothetical protein